MPKVAVIGSTGMLGREVARSKFDGYEVVEWNRRSTPVVSTNEHIQIDSNLTHLEEKMNMNDISFVVNCAGLIRQKIDEDSLSSRAQAVKANFDLPLRLVSLSEKYNFKIIQIGTDCVFSGRHGNYKESDIHDAEDIYGKTKSLGEIPHENLIILRTSIVGLEAQSNSSLLSWFINQSRNARVKGYSDQIWNGVTIFHFAKFVTSIIDQNGFNQFSGVHHVVPSDSVSKDKLLKIFGIAFGREDIEIDSVATGRDLDMTLGTNHPSMNSLLWKLAGYSHPPTIEEMILEYSSLIQSGG